MLGYTPPGQTSPGQTPPLGRYPLPADVYYSGRYASYWNAFLFAITFQDTLMTCQKYQICVIYENLDYDVYSPQGIPSNTAPPTLASND